MLSVVERTLSWKLRQSLLTTSQFTMGALPPAAVPPQFQACLIGEVVPLP
jgi:hypothetical protein